MTRKVMSTGMLMAFVLTVAAFSLIRRTNSAIELTQPDTSQAQPLGRWPNADDLARLESVEGQTQSMVLKTLGHPAQVGRTPDGEEVWDYPWSACCRVWIKDVTCTRTFYTAGY